MLALTFSTGIIDAVGYLGLDRVFTGNMTGNVVILGMALTGNTPLPVAGPALALVTFMGGAALGGRVLRGRGQGWSRATTGMLAGVGAALALLTVVVVAVGPVLRLPVALAVTGALGLLMGVQAATARTIGVADVSTVVVTSTLTALSAESRLAGGRGQTWFRRAAAVVLIGAGAAVGALLLSVHLGLGVAASAAVTLVVAVLGHRVAGPAGGVATRPRRG